MAETNITIRLTYWVSEHGQIAEKNAVRVVPRSTTYDELRTRLGLPDGMPLQCPVDELRDSLREWEYIYNQKPAPESWRTADVVPLELKNERSKYKSFATRDPGACGTETMAKRHVDTYYSLTGPIREHRTPRISFLLPEEGKEIPRPSEAERKKKAGQNLSYGRLFSYNSVWREGLSFNLAYVPLGVVHNTAKALRFFVEPTSGEDNAPSVNGETLQELLDLDEALSIRLPDRPRLFRREDKKDQQWKKLFAARPDEEWQSFFDVWLESKACPLPASWLDVIRRCPRTEDWCEELGLHAVRCLMALLRDTPGCTAEVLAINRSLNKIIRRLPSTRSNVDFARIASRIAGTAGAKKMLTSMFPQAQCRICGQRK